MVECSLSLFSPMVKGQKKMIGTSTHSQHKKSRPDFALLHIQEIQKLGEQKASGTTIRIYMVLCAYAMNGSFCFPNYQTIAEIAGIQSKTFQQIVSRSLSWLSEHGFIEKSSNKISPIFESNYYLINIKANYLNSLNFLKYIQEYKMAILPYCFEPRMAGESFNTMGDNSNMPLPGEVEARIIVNIPNYKDK